MTTWNRFKVTKSGSNKAMQSNWILSSKTIFLEKATSSGSSQPFVSTVCAWTLLAFCQSLFRRPRWLRCSYAQDLEARSWLGAGMLLAFVLATINSTQSILNSVAHARLKTSISIKAISKVVHLTIHLTGGPKKNLSLFLSRTSQAILPLWISTSKLLEWAFSRYARSTRQLNWKSERLLYSLC